MMSEFGTSEQLKRRAKGFTLQSVRADAIDFEYRAAQHSQDGWWGVATKGDKEPFRGYGKFRTKEQAEAKVKSLNATAERMNNQGRIKIRMPLKDSTLADAKGQVETSNGHQIREGNGNQDWDKFYLEKDGKRKGPFKTRREARWEAEHGRQDSTLADAAAAISELTANCDALEERLSRADASFPRVQTLMRAAEEYKRNEARGEDNKAVGHSEQALYSMRNAMAIAGFSMEERKAFSKETGIPLDKIMSAKKPQRYL